MSLSSITSFNAPRVRIDTWNMLAGIANRIHHSLDNKEQCKEVSEEVLNHLTILKSFEKYHAFPGLAICDKILNLFQKEEFEKFCTLVDLTVQALRANNCNYKQIGDILRAPEIDQEKFLNAISITNKYYFEVLVVREVSDTTIRGIQKEKKSYTNTEEKFIYDFLFLNTFEDAIIAIMLNYNIRACLISDYFHRSKTEEPPIFHDILKQTLLTESLDQLPAEHRQASELAKTIRNIRENEVDLFYLCSYNPEKSSLYLGNIFDRIFYELENFYELHLIILEAMRQHYETPFFDSLKRYALEPKSTFHALPIARGKSIFTSKCLQDMQDFYGKNIFLAESSSTIGGLDSLMHPIGSIRKAMDKASRFFGSHQTFFVTNGTSASNKIVLQSVLNPGDLVLIEHSCHESHHYGLILTGAIPVFLSGYRTPACDIAGPVPLKNIKSTLLSLKKNNLLHKVKLIVLTNCTFDGLVYNPQKYMEEILAIKPDIIFLWDEAWFAYARCVPHYRRRTAMFAAAFLETKYASKEYAAAYKKFKDDMEAHKGSDEFMLNTALLPDPSLVKIRAFSTQSTHKSLSCLRQGSMIHIYNHDFNEFRESFNDAFVTHSTTSPNYQILATMDLARRQAELEGFELMKNAIELAMIFREQINSHPLISEYFQALGTTEMIPDAYRISKVKSGYVAERDWSTVETAWAWDEIVIDPTRVTLLIKKGVTGPTLKTLLMDKFGIQLNKVSSNSILIQFNIGTLRSSVSLFLEALMKISQWVKIGILPNEQTTSFLPSPEFSTFSEEYRLTPDVPASGDLRRAFYASQNKEAVEYISLKEISQLIKEGQEIVAAAIIIPYPPGYPALLPGQVITQTLADYLLDIDPNCMIGAYTSHEAVKIFKRKSTLQKDQLRGHQLLEDGRVKEEHLEEEGDRFEEDDLVEENEHLEEDDLVEEDDFFEEEDHMEDGDDRLEKEEDQRSEE